MASPFFLLRISMEFKRIIAISSNSSIISWWKKIYFCLKKKNKKRFRFNGCTLQLHLYCMYAVAYKPWRICSKCFGRHGWGRGEGSFVKLQAEDLFVLITFQIGGTPKTPFCTFLGRHSEDMLRAAQLLYTPPHVRNMQVLLRAKSFSYSLSRDL